MKERNKRRQWEWRWCGRQRARQWSTAQNDDHGSQKEEQHLDW